MSARWDNNLLLYRKVFNTEKQNSRQIRYEMCYVLCAPYITNPYRQ